MTDEVSAPLVPLDVDLRGFPGFVLDVDRLLASELFALCTPEQGWAAFTLWCRAWKQTPPGSMPNDERLLAAFSGAGKRWPKVRDMALRGFVKCSDGRLYHQVLCEQAMDAWGKRQAYRTKREKDAKRLADWRERNVKETPDETPLKRVSTQREGEVEVKGSEVNTRSKPLGSSDIPLSPDEIEILIPLNNKTECPISKVLVTELEGLYPAVDVPQTLREIRAWCITNPHKRKTKGGVLRFINAWLSKEQNKG